MLFGGTSTEREISLMSGNACLQALLKRGVDAHPFDPRDKPLSELVTRNFDRVFIALHGPGGEDGTLQGALEFLGMPYTGSGVMGSAIGMDKLRTKRLAQAVGIPTTDYMVLRSPADLDTCLERLGLPLIVKPATQGSSVGMTKVEKAEQLLGAFQAAALLEPERVRRAVDHRRANTPSPCCRDARCRRSASRRRRPSTITRPSTSATTRSISARRACRPKPRSTSRISRWPPSPPWAPRAGAAPTS